MLITDLAINGLAVGAQVVLTHGVSENGIGYQPNFFECTPAWPLNIIAATATTVTVRNDDPVSAYTGSLRCVRIHSIQAGPTVTKLGLLHPVGMNPTWAYNLSVGGLMNIGVAQINRIRMLGAPGIIVQGNTVTIGADTYEFRNSSPPLGGTAGNIWVFNGTGGAADAVISRANFIDAVNGVVDAARITRTAQAPTAGTNVEHVKALAGLVTGDIIVVSADAVGGNIVPTGTQQGTTETLTTVTDIWDTANMHSGRPQLTGRVAYATAVISANDISKGSVQVAFPFTLIWANVSNMMRAQDEAWTLVGNNFVSLALASGGSPHNQANDVIMIEAWGI